MRTRDILGMIGICAILAGCGGGGGGDMRAAFEKQILIMEEFSSAMEKAANADQVAAALDRYTREIEKLEPRMKALRDKHPELAAMDATGDFPEELKDLEESFGAMAMNMMRAMAKVMQYGRDPAVMEAQQRMLEAAQKLAPAGDR